MKVVNNRENVWKNGVMETNYVARERESRYGRWRNDMERNGYKRSYSRLRYCRNGAVQSALRYVKDRKRLRFRSQSRGARVQLQGARFAGSQSNLKIDLCLKKD